MRLSLQRVRRAFTRRYLGTITRFDTAEPVVALTFDDGPDPHSTPQVLELLERHRAHGTFFVVGEAPAAAPALVRLIAAAGHSIANHTWQHRSMPELPPRERRFQIRACAQTIAPHGSRLFRPPWGRQTLASQLDTRLLRHEVVGWNVDIGDWYEINPREMADQLATAVNPGSIVLLHDHIRSEPSPTGTVAVNYSRVAMLEALDLFLRSHRHRFRFLTVPQMFHFGRPIRQSWLLPSASLLRSTHRDPLASAARV